MRPRRPSSGFSLIEIIVVVVITGLLASMAIPRMKGSTCAATDATLDADLAVVRRAILLYAAEHGGRLPGPDASTTENQLLRFSDVSDATSPTRGGPFCYGPYLAAIPRAPVGPNKGDAHIYVDPVNSPPRVRTAGGNGWIYNPNTGEFYANVNGLDQGGVTLSAGGG